MMKGESFGIYAGTKGDGHQFTMIIGWIALVLGILGFIPGVNDVLLSLLNINTGISVLHLVIGIVSLGLYYGVKK